MRIHRSASKGGANHGIFGSFVFGFKKIPIFCVSWGFFGKCSAVNNWAQVYRYSVTKMYILKISLNKSDLNVSCCVLFYGKLVLGFPSSSPAFHASNSLSATSWHFTSPNPHSQSSSSERRIWVGIASPAFGSRPITSRTAPNLGKIYA